MNAPTLLVGLGGTGSGIVQKVYELATENQRKNIAFVVFDTDVNELRAIEEKTPQIRVVQTSTRLTVGEYLDFDHYSRDNWFPVNRILNGKALTEGAGQVRAVSRLALNTAIQQGKMAPLNEAIEQLYKLSGQRTVQAPRVILAGSLCGGTGSGLILPVAMYIRNFMSTKLQQGSAIIRGFFLLPEVFDGVIKTQSERNNLRSNAYAAVREIDAFMMKDDGSLPDRYDLKFFAPRAGSKIPEEYTGRPMDFCFLFDAQNLNGMKLNSFAEYKEHAANCIYGMAIAPTSKRSNSSEDNVIREIVFAGGRNRFAGAGSSMLIYPTEDIKRYLTLCWTKESISSEWLDVDHRYADELRTNRNMRKQGYPTAELDRGDHYIQVINEGLKEQRPFASAIRSLCIEYKSNGLTEKGINWIQYVDALGVYIDERVRSQREELQDIIDELSLVEAAGGESSAKEDTFMDWYLQLLGYKTATIKCANNVSRNICYSLFKEKKDYTKTEQIYRLEYWLHPKRDAKNFIHPNAVRYLLYNARNTLRTLAAEKLEQKKAIEEYWKSFDAKTFDMPDTPDVVEKDIGEYLGGTKLRLEGMNRFLHKSSISETQAHLKTSFQNYHRKIEEYWDASVSYDTYQNAVDYITNICAAFHDFYDVLDRSIVKIDKEIEQLEQKYCAKPGEALRYVCADQICLRGLASSVVNTSSSLDLPADLTRGIFDQMKQYALTEQKPKAEEYFTDTFKSTIMGYLEKEIVSHYSSLVEMDIITALEKEAYYSSPDTTYNLDDQRLYAQHVIESTELLAKPFIESPIGKEARVIPACAYNPELAEADFPGRKLFVDKFLKDGGGVSDDSIDRNMILFYQAVYDIRANMLSKFAPPQQADTFDRPGGEYYKAYYELIEQIHPETVKSKAITPHINRWWHVISMLPDLDETSQEMQEKRIYKAFFWGILGRYIQLHKEDDFHLKYYADKAYLGLNAEEDEHLVVSNGTPCDHLYEVLDAFTIYPRLVTIVNEKIKERIDNDLYRKTPLLKSTLYDMLQNFRVQEYRLAEVADQDGIRSAFELPLLMKRSVPAEKYYEENMILLFDTILAELKMYLDRFCTVKDMPAIYNTLVMAQFDQMISNMKEEGGDDLDIFNDKLFFHICKTIAKSLDDMGMYESAKEVQETLRKLSY